MLEERLDARDEDARPAAPPGGERRDPGRGLVGDQLAPLVGQRGPRLEDGDGLGIAEPRAELLGHPVADLGVAGDPDEPLAVGRQREGRREVALGAVRHSHQADVPAGPSRVVPGTPPGARGGPRTCRSRRAAAGARTGPGAAGRHPSDLARTAGRATAGAGRRAAVGSPALRASSTSASTAAMSKSTAVSGCGGGVAGREVGRDALGDPAVATAPAAQRRLGHAQASGLAGRMRRQPVCVRRIPSASGGPSTSPGAASRVVSAGRSSNMLKRLAALFVPSRAHSSTASAAASRSSSRRCCSSGAKRVRTWSTARPVRLADPDPQPAELLGPELVDDRAQAVVAARPAALAEAQLAERQREVVGDDEQVDQRGVLARQHLADREAGVVHVGQRLDERQVEAPEAAHGDVGRVALAALAGPAGALGDPVHDQPADVVARAGVLRAGVAETDDDLQPSLRGQHDRARSRRWEGLQRW